MYFAVLEEHHKEPTVYKLIVVGPEEKVVGVHILGQGSDEVMQGFAVAVKMGGESRFPSTSDIFQERLMSISLHSDQGRFG